MLSNILITIAVILVALIVIIAMQPSDFVYSASKKMSAKPETIFAQVNDFYKWGFWSPWAKLDLNAKNVFEGPSSGKGAVFRWDGNNKVGAGNMTITESRPDELIVIRIEFLKPMAAVNKVEFTFKPEGDQTLVTWNMSGKANFMAKAVGLLMNCKKMVGGMFDQGLENLKAVVEAAPK